MGPMIISLTTRSRGIFLAEYHLSNKLPSLYLFISVFWSHWKGASYVFKSRN